MPGGRVEYVDLSGRIEALRRQMENMAIGRCRLLTDKILLTVSREFDNLVCEFMTRFPPGAGCNSPPHPAGPARQD
ncbi:MAG: aspartyl-phosphate phosphatase Spo0E family protein [Bacillota bacterium]